jgi:pentatricopeptide repeat domain-containing protein 1
MASALEARTKFPQLVTGEEKRVRFVVVHGLELVEHPNMRPEDAEWFVISCP